MMRASKWFSDGLTPFTCRESERHNVFKSIFLGWRTGIWVTFPSAGSRCCPPFCHHDHRWGHRTNPVAGSGPSHPDYASTGWRPMPRGGRGPARWPYWKWRSILGVHWQCGRGEGEWAASISVPCSSGVLLAPSEHTTPQLVPCTRVQPISFLCAYFQFRMVYWLGKKLHLQCWYLPWK